MIPLAEDVLAGQTRAIARAISRVENGHPDKEALIDALYPHGGTSLILGLTGPPGSGKSSLLDLLIDKERSAGKSIAVIAVDPTSPFSGGAILGDRLRMQKHATDDHVFIRSMASRGHLGGVAGATSDAIKVLDAAGFDIIIIETIGVGQTEIDIVELSDIVMLVLVPGLGDEIQALKAGVMEIGDIFIVNKSDRDDADKVKAHIEYVLNFKYMEKPDQKNPIVMTSAVKQDGINTLRDTIQTYYQTILNNGMLEQKRKQRIKAEIKNLITAKIKSKVEAFLHDQGSIEAMVDGLYEKKRSPYAIINEKLNRFLQEKQSI
ncbi:MAG: methylmalonyl Co-A mutase-associated GTPase MeaB [Caldithrix sp.]|nr:methylmalonyl Co-A mutase-associated GTPase MeaB [Caldithrix sp.]